MISISASDGVFYAATRETVYVWSGEHWAVVGKARYEQHRGSLYSTTIAADGSLIVSGDYTQIGGTPAASGRRVTVIADEPRALGHNVVSWNLDGISPGVYHCILTTHDAQAVHAVVVF